MEYARGVPNGTSNSFNSKVNWWARSLSTDVSGIEVWGYWYVRTDYKSWWVTSIYRLGIIFYMCMLRVSTIFIGTVQIKVSKRCPRRIVSYPVKRHGIFGLDNNFGFFIINTSCDAVPMIWAIFLFTWGCHWVVPRLVGSGEDFFFFKYHI
jgi:hypothetical protein